MIRENQVIRAGVYCLLLSLNMSPRVEVENQIFESLNDIKYRADYLSNSKKNKEIDEFKRKIADLISKFNDMLEQNSQIREQFCQDMEKQIPMLEKELEEL